MKYIPLHKHDQWNSKDVIATIARTPGPSGIDLEDLRLRARVLDAVQKSPETGMMLEDADHAHLVKLVKEFKFGTAAIELLQIVEGIIDAKAPPAAMLQAAAV